MSLHPKQFRENIVRPALQLIEAWSQAAEDLVCGTAYQESRLVWIRQLDNGPARGLFQMEPATHDDIWENYLSFRPGLQNLVLELLSERPSRHQQLSTNLVYAAAMCRIHYLRQKPPIPEDLTGQAHYWKTHYNTFLGRGTMTEYITSYKEFEND